jgi:hypothetical protein
MRLIQTPMPLNAELFEYYPAHWSTVPSMCGTAHLVDQVWCSLGSSLTLRQHHKAEMNIVNKTTRLPLISDALFAGASQAQAPTAVPSMPSVLQ